MDNRGSHFYLVLYWAQALTEQTEDKDLQSRFSPVWKQLSENEAKIIEELKAAQGKAVDLGGYYRLDQEKVTKVMRPSATLNAVVDSIT